MEKEKTIVKKLADYLLDNLELTTKRELLKELKKEPHYLFTLYEIKDIIDKNGLTRANEVVAFMDEQNAELYNRLDIILTDKTSQKHALKDDTSVTSLTLEELGPLAASADLSSDERSPYYQELFKRLIKDVFVQINQVLRNLKESNDLGLSSAKLTIRSYGKEIGKEKGTDIKNKSDFLNYLFFWSFPKLFEGVNPKLFSDPKFNEGMSDFLMRASAWLDNIEPGKVQELKEMITSDRSVTDAMNDTNNQMLQELKLRIDRTRKNMLE